MGDVISFEAAKAQKSQLLSTYPALECPKCDALCQPIKVDEHGSVHHRCTSQDKSHRPFTWRINTAGEMLKGSKGNVQYRI